MITKKPRIHFIEKIHGKYRYICIQAVEPTQYKSTKMQGLVTCKNCLQILKGRRKQ